MRWRAGEVRLWSSPPLSQRGSPRSDSEKSRMEGAGGVAEDRPEPEVPRFRTQPPTATPAPYPRSYLSSVQVVPEHRACAQTAELICRQEEKLIRSSAASLPGAVSSLQMDGRGVEGDPSLKAQ